MRYEKSRALVGVAEGMTLHDTTEEHRRLVERIGVKFHAVEGLERRRYDLLNQSRLTLGAGFTAKVCNRQDVKVLRNRGEKANLLGIRLGVDRGQIERVGELERKPCIDLLDKMIWQRLVHTDARL